MFLSEMVRHVGDENDDIDVASQYTRNVASWGTIHDYGTVNPAAASIYLLRFQVQSTTNHCEFRVKVGSRYVYGAQSTGGGGWTAHETVCYIPSGSHSVIAENRMWAVGTGYIRNFMFGPVEFSDVDGESLQTYSSGLTLNVPQRNLPIGSIKRVCVVVNCWAYTSGADTNFENVGDSLTNGVSLTFEGSQVDWTEREQDDNAKENAWAVYYGVAESAQDITLSIMKDNGSTVVHISVVACPWILPDDTDFEPIILSFPQGSTLYLMLEPLHENVTKNIKIGKKRAISFGDSTDYYSTASGTNILTHNYQFVEVKNGAVLLLIYGRGGCVSSIGVDIR